jgi:polyphosphate kinase
MIVNGFEPGLTWLSFNRRVHEAEDERTPLLKDSPLLLSVAILMNSS